MSSIERELPDDLEQVKRVLDLIGTLGIILDEERRITHFNAQARQLTGFSEKKMLGRDMADSLLPESQRDRYNALLDRGRQGESRTHEGFWQTTKKNKFVCIHSTISSFTCRSDGTTWLVVSGIDISARKRAEQELLFSEAKLRAIHDGAVNGIITIDNKGRIESVNKATLNMFGYTEDELLGNNVKMLAPPPHREKHDKYISSYLHTGEARIIGIGRELTARRKDGSEFPIELTVIELELPDRRMFTGIVRDVTERKRFEHEAHQRLTEHAHASRLSALGEMASGIAHELNQPLTAIVSFADACKRILQSDDPQMDVVERTLGEIAQQGERAGNIIRRLREFVRKGKVERQAVRVNDIVEEVLRILDHELRLQQVQVECDYGDDLPTINADKLQIEQVILNLFRNAIDAMEQCSTRNLRVTTGRRDDNIVIEVIDSGNGFSTQHAAQLFDAFFTTKSQGTGLGLSISQSIVTAHGGELSAESNANGATFIVSLPLP